MWVIGKYKYSEKVQLPKEKGRFFDQRMTGAEDDFPFEVRVLSQKQGRHPQKHPENAGGVPEIGTTPAPGTGLPVEAGNDGFRGRKGLPIKPAMTVSEAARDCRSSRQ